MAAGGKKRGKKAAVAPKDTAAQQYWEKKYINWRDHPDSTEFWDVTLECEDGSVVHASRSDLACWSEYFQTLFLSHYKDKATRHVLLKSVSGASLHAIIESLYKQQTVRVHPHNVQELLYAADLLQIDSVKDACEQYMMSTLTNCTAVGYYMLADLHTCLDTVSAAEKYLVKHLPELILNGDGYRHVAELGADKILKLLGLCTVEWRCSTGLLDVYRALRTAGDRVTAGLGLDQVLELVPTEQCTLSELEALQADPLANTSPTFQQRLATAAMGIAKQATASRNRLLRLVEPRVGHVWCVADWPTQSTSASKLVSPEFYIPGKGGWVMELYPRGVGGGSGSHVSLFVRPTFRDVEAPVMLRFTLRLLHPTDPQQDVIKTAENAFLSPCEDWGFAEFMSLAAFEAEYASWVCDDALFVCLAALDGV